MAGKNRGRVKIPINPNVKPGQSVGTPTPTPSSGGGSGGGGGGADAGLAWSKAQAAKQEAKERAAARASVQNSMALIANLKGQRSALRAMLRTGFKKDLNRGLERISMRLGEDVDLLNKEHDEKYGTLVDKQEANERAAGDSSAQNLANRSRERASAMDELALHGAGESDSLRAQMMSLRNWAANQGEVNRAFHDGLDSVNSDITGLNAETRTGLVNIHKSAEEQRRQEWDNFYDRKADAYTNLSNVQGEIARQFGDIWGIQLNPSTRNVGKGLRWGEDGKGGKGLRGVDDKGKGGKDGKGKGKGRSGLAPGAGGRGDEAPPLDSEAAARWSEPALNGSEDLWMTADGGRTAFDYKGREPGEMSTEDLPGPEREWSDLYTKDGKRKPRNGPGAGGKGGRKRNKWNTSVNLGKAEDTRRQRDYWTKRSIQSQKKVSKLTGKGYAEKALPDDVLNYQGSAQLEGKQNYSNANLGFSEVGPVGSVEGATLRKW